MEQAQQLAHESEWLLDQVGVGVGARVLEIGCGPEGSLGLLNLSVRLIADGLRTHDELESLKWAIAARIADPEVLVVPGVYFQGWGRRP